MTGFNKKILLLCAAFLSALTSNARTLIDTMYSKVMESHIELVYTYSVRVSGINTVGQGTLYAQDDLWHVDGNGIKMWCDGSSMWIVDPTLKEVVVEPAGHGTDYLSNPALLFTQMDRYFNVRKSSASEDGESMLYILEPKQSGEVQYCNVELFRKDASIRSATFAMTDGNLLEIKVSSMIFSQKKNLDAFRPAISFDSTWIVTDLR